MSDNDQNIEDFFRKRLGDPAKREFPFRESDWELMEARLDALPPAGGWWSGTTKVAIGVAIVIGSFLSGWFLKDYFDEGDASKAPANSSISKDLSPSAENVEDSSSLSLTAGEQTNSGETVAEEVSSGAVELQVAEEEEGQPAQDFFYEEPTVLNKASERSSLPAVNSISQLSSKAASTTAKSLAPALNRFSGVAPAALETSGRLEMQAIELASIPTPAVPGEDVVNRPTPEGFRMAAGLAFTPDLSSVGLQPRMSEVGQAYGLLVEFNASRLLKLSTGAYRSNKVYTAGKGDYNPPFYSGWPGGIEPVKTDAACSVLDIPLTASLRVADFGKTRIWISSGLSSYWMLSEDYRYSYDPGNEGRYAGWSGKNESKHLFSVASASVSVETFLSPHFSIQLEPFLKMPLGGVGYGKVYLYTTGALLSAKYHFLKNHKPTQ